MATWDAGTTLAINTAGVAGARAITAGRTAIICVNWEIGTGSPVVTSGAGCVTDASGGTWAIAIQRINAVDGDPNAAILYCLNHPGGGAVAPVVNFSGGTAGYPNVSFLSFDGGGGGVDGTPTGDDGDASSSFTAPNINTTGAGFVIQFLGGFQACVGVTAGGTPLFARDTATEDASTPGTGFVQYLLSASAQTVSPAASWGAATARYSFVAAAFKDGSVGSGPTIDTQPVSQTCYAGQTSTFTVSATTSGGTLHYQWKDDGVNVGTDSNSYTTAAGALSDNGAQITCDVTDDNGTTTTAAATWKVLPTAVSAWMRA